MASRFNSNVPFSKSFELLNSSHSLLYCFPSWFLSTGQHFGFSPTESTRLLRYSSNHQASHFGCLLFLFKNLCLLLGLVVFLQSWNCLWNVSTKASRKQFEVCKHNFRNVKDTQRSCSRFHTHRIVQRYEQSSTWDVSYRLCVANTFCLTCFAGGVPVTECVSLFFVGNGRKTRK